MSGGPIAPLAAGLCFALATLAFCRRWQLGFWLGAAGAAILAGAMVARGLLAGRWPLTDMYEFALAFALCTSLAALVVGRPRSHPEGVAGNHAVKGATMLLSAVLVFVARLLMPASSRAIQPLRPALDSVWLPLHVGTAALSYGFLAMAGAAAFIWLVYRTGHPEVERLRDRAIAAGYPLLTLSLIFGMIWAQAAWGRYWAWDLKEVCTLLTWLVYTLYWHLRGRPCWWGRRLAWLALAGLGAVLFTFLGVGWLAATVGLQSLHLF